MCAKGGKLSAKARRGRFHLTAELATTPSYVSVSALAFHEKAGRCQELLWLGKFISDIFLCPDIGHFLAGEAAVKAERSEFILSLDGRRCQP